MWEYLVPLLVLIFAVEIRAVSDNGRLLLNKARVLNNKWHLSRDLTFVSEKVPILEFDLKSVLGYDLHLFDLHYGAVGEVGNGLTGQVAQEGNIGSEGTDVESHRIGLQVIVVTFQADSPRLAVIELILYQLALHEGHCHIAYIVDAEEVFLHLGRGW